MQKVRDVLIDPSPLVIKENPRIINTTLLSGSSSILLDDIRVSSGEQILVFLNGILQATNSFTVESTEIDVDQYNTTIVFGETATTDYSVTILIGYILQSVYKRDLSDPNFVELTYREPNKLEFTMSKYQGDIFYANITQNTSIYIRTTFANRIAMLILKGNAGYTVDFETKILWTNGSPPSSNLEGLNMFHFTKVNIPFEGNDFIILGTYILNMS